MANPKYVPRHHSITIKEVKVAGKMQFLVSKGDKVFAVSSPTPVRNKADKLSLSIPKRWRVSKVDNSYDMDETILSTHRFFAHAVGNAVTRAMKSK